MAILRTKDIRKMSMADREKNFDELNLRLLKFRSKIAGGGNVENPGQIREIRRCIARILTINHEDRRAANEKISSEASVAQKQ
jgi:large subunit ribosomal protein L29